MLLYMYDINRTHNTFIGFYQVLTSQFHLAMHNLHNKVFGVSSAMSHRRSAFFSPVDLNMNCTHQNLLLQASHQNVSLHQTLHRFG